MTTISPDKLKKKLAVAGEAFDRQISSALGRIYWEGLKHCDADAVEAAIDRAIRDLKFFPRLGELLEFIEGSPRTRAEISWAGVMELLASYGCDGAACKKFQVDGATAWAMERLGGLEGLCRMSVSDLNFSRPRYIALYERAVTDGRHHRAAEIYGKKQRKLLSTEFRRHQLAAAPETIAPPRNAAPALESEEQKLIGRQIDSHMAKLAAMKAMPK